MDNTDEKLNISADEPAAEIVADSLAVAEAEPTTEAAVSTEPTAEAPAEFHTDVERGLSSAEVEERKLAGKVNGNQNVKTKSIWQILRGNIITFFNLVFVIFGVIMCFCVDWSNLVQAVGNFSFLILIVFNALIGIIQEIRAKRTIDKLSLISAPKATVVRDGEEIEIAVNDIVLDDITVLSAGSQICADAVVTDGTIEVNESLITGEPDAIVKKSGDRIMSGSFVLSGKAKAQVEHVGADNFANKISAGAKYFKKPNSEIWRSLMLIVKVMAFIIVPIGIALFCVKYFLQDNDETVQSVIISAITSVIGMIPSGLVALSSTVFCVSVIRLSKRNVLAQDLYCVETLARVDVLCLDKTGTITEGTMEVKQIVPAEKEEDEIKQIIRNVTAALADDNATANALRSFVSDLEVTSGAESTVPFSSARKWSGARIDGVSYVLGAAEFVFKNPDENIKATTAEMAKKGFRVLVLASSLSDFGENALPDGLKLESFIYITDLIRKEAPDTLRFFKEQGVNVKIISGDNPETVRAVALRAGLEDCDNIIDMSTLTTEEEVREAALKYTIFGRVLPDQKLMLVNALKANGHTVAMTGDGVNDVLALKAADCSIAMASGSDAAKNVSSLVLLDSNFASMPKVVAEGRRSINNLERSAALYLMKTVYNTLLAILFMIVSHPLPFTPQHLTLMGGVTIGLPSLVLALEPNDGIVEGRFLPKVLNSALPGGFTVLLGAIAVVLCNEYFLTDLADSQATTLFIIVITFVGFMLLFKMSMPFNVVRLITFVLMIALFACSFAVPLPNDFILTMFNLDNNITWDMGKAILAICAILFPIYVALNYGMKFIKHKFGAGWERRFSTLDAKMRARLQ